MSAKEILFDAKARERLAAGVDKLANAEIGRALCRERV